MSFKRSKNALCEIRDAAFAAKSENLARYLQSADGWNVVVFKVRGRNADRRDARIVQRGLIMAEKTRIHPETGETLRRGVRPMTVSYAIYSKVIEVPGWYPEGEGDAIHTGKDLAEWNEVYQQMRMDYAKKVRSLRLRLKLTQEEAGRVLGGGKRAFQKYETGKTPPSDAAVALLEMMERHPEDLEVLKALPGRQVGQATAGHHSVLKGTGNRRGT